MAGFVQIIQWQTSRIDEVEAMSEEYRANRDATTGPARVLILADRDNPGTYYTVAQFASAEAAEANNGRPETEAFAKRMGELCDGPPTFHNTDVVEDHSFS
jgi:quinol monooxygenase YgiN